jgi:ATP-dependent DNA helicase RecG
MKNNGLPLPEFDTYDDRTHLVICLPVHQEAVSEKTPEKTPVKTSGETSVKTSVKILSLMRENSQVTTAEIAGTIGKTTRAIEMQVAKLKAEGLVERIGPDKGGHWVVRGKA